LPKYCFKKKDFENALYYFNKADSIPLKDCLNKNKEILYGYLSDLYKEKGINSSSVGDVLKSLNNGSITQNHLTDIMQKGFDTFKKETGRSMTYGEMRDMYG
jgi:hypothetical protein